MSRTSASRQRWRSRISDRRQQIPAHRGSPADGAADTLADQGLVIFRRQAESGADCPQIIFGQDVAGGEVLGHIERTPEDQRVLLLLSQAVIDLAERHPGALGFDDEGRHLVRLHGEGRIDAAIGAGKRKMLLDNGGAQGDARDACPDAEGMVRQSHLAAEQCAHMRDGQQVGIGGRGGIGAGAFQQDQILAAGLPCTSHRFVDVGDGRHARRNDHRLAGCGNFANERQVRILERRDLVAGHAELLEEVDGRRIERRRERYHAKRTRTLEDRRVPVPGRMGFLVELVERSSLPKAVGIVDEELIAGEIQRHRIGCIGLQLERMRARLRRRIDDRQRAVERLIVIAGHLRNDERPVRTADRTALDHDGFTHRALPLFQCVQDSDGREDRRTPGSDPGPPRAAGRIALRARGSSTRVRWRTASH
ncbi:hypothetical protein NUACC26_019890 [Scytonema sp. NUACC26]